MADSYLAKKNPTSLVSSGVCFGSFRIPNAVGLGKKDRLHVQVQGRYVSILRGKDGALQLGGNKKIRRFFLFGGADAKSRSWEEKVDVCVKKVLKDQGWTACNALANVDGKRGFFTMQVQPFV